VKKLIQSIFIFLFFIFSTSLTLRAQDTLYYDENNKITVDKESAKSYRVHTVTGEGNEYKYYKMNGTLDKEDIYTYHSYQLKKKFKTDTTQLSKEYEYVGNKLYWEKPFKNGKLHGTFIVYWEDGKIQSKYEYVDGKFAQGIRFEKTGEVDEEPEFPGGVEGFYKYMRVNLKYPRDASESGIGGTVIVSFAIEKDGRITEVKIESSVCKSIDEEAIRVVTNMPKWKPAMQDQKPVRVYYLMPIQFRVESATKNLYW